MKKILLALVALTFLFCACNKEGVYTPKKKITAIYLQKTDNDPKELLESYHWDGNKLKARLFRCSILSKYTEDFEVVPTYEGKRIVRVDERFSGDYVEYIYEGKLLSKLSYHSGNEYAEATVEHKDGKISRIFIPGKSISKVCAEKLMKTILPINEVQQFYKQLQCSTKSLAARDIELLFTWNGDNISEHKTTGFGDDGGVLLCYEATYLYDNKYNPLAINWSDFGSQTNIGQYAIDAKMLNMSKNNVIQINTINTAYITPEWVMSDTLIKNISYEYDGEYPMKAIHTDLKGDTMEIDYYEYLQ